jgi:hypothetical protein
MVCLPLAGLNHGAASDRWPTWGQASLPRSGFVQVPSLAKAKLGRHIGREAGGLFRRSATFQNRSFKNRLTYC